MKMTVTIPGGLFRTFSRLSASAWLASWGWRASTQPGHGWHTDESEDETRFYVTLSQYTKCYRSILIPRPVWTQFYISL